MASIAGAFSATIYNIATSAGYMLHLQMLVRMQLLCVPMKEPLYSLWPGEAVNTSWPS